MVSVNVSAVQFNSPNLVAAVMSAMIAIDLGVYIEFGKLRALKKRSSDNSVIEGAYYARGVIDYIMLQFSKINWRVGVPLSLLGIVIIGGVIGESMDDARQRRLVEEFLNETTASAGGSKS